MAEEKIKEEEETAEDEAEEKVSPEVLEKAKKYDELVKKAAEEEARKKLKEELRKELSDEFKVEKVKSEAVVSDSMIKEEETNLIFEKYGGETSFWVMPESDGKLRRAS